MQTEEKKIQFDDLKHRDYKTLSPEKKRCQTNDDKPDAGDVIDGVCKVDDKNDEYVDKEGYDEEAPRKKRVPRRILHFSDGTLEEYSTDEEEEDLKRKQFEEEERKRKQALIDPRSLTWIPWMVHYTWFAGSTVVAYCDSWGEKLAWFFGITSPKYYYELEEFKRIKEEEDERKKKLQSEMHGWIENEPHPEVVGTDPTKSEPN